MTTRAFAVSLASRGATMLAAALLAVLTLASSSAWAECAWVLWAQIPDGDRVVAGAMGAWPTRSECEVQRVAAQSSYKPRDAKDVGLYTCLPDTVDPRAPKTSGR
jgi:hypothetical protein